MAATGCRSWCGTPWDRTRWPRRGARAWPRRATAAAAQLGPGSGAGGRPVGPDAPGDLGLLPPGPEAVGARSHAPDPGVIAAAGPPARAHAVAAPRGRGAVAL